MQMHPGLEQQANLLSLNNTERRNGHYFAPLDRVSKNCATVHSFITLNFEGCHLLRVARNNTIIKHDNGV